MPFQRETKAIKVLQDKASDVEKAHANLRAEIEELQRRLNAIEGVEEVQGSSEWLESRQKHLDDMTSENHLQETDLASIYKEAEKEYPENLGIRDILTAEDVFHIEGRLSDHVNGFNRRYSLDGWDYAIAGGCGLFASMLDILCVSAPPKPTVAWAEKVDGIFNQYVQKSFNNLLPPDVSHKLSMENIIGAPDSSTVADLIGGPKKALNPLNHRLRSLSHDPILGFIFGVVDMLRNTCTTVVDGRIVVIPSSKDPVSGSIFQLLGRMFGHLLSDVNAPSLNGNRGMGIPAPFMGLLRMLESIPVGDSDFGKQIEWMYVNGYDFRQFVASSVPMTIMELLLRIFYVGKQVKLYGAGFGETLLDTVPLRLNPRFRIMLALAYGTSSAVNAGKMYVTGNILDANYASWMGLVWNGFHALKWSLYGRHMEFWRQFEEKEIESLEMIVLDIDGLAQRAAHLPG